MPYLYLIMQTYLRVGGAAHPCHWALGRVSTAPSWTAPEPRTGPYGVIDDAALSHRPRDLPVTCSLLRISDVPPPQEVRVASPSGC